MGIEDLVGRCGLYCGACGIYRAERDDQEWRKRLAEHFKCPIEKVRCAGCSALTPQCWGYECKIVKCLNENGYQYCYECSQYRERSCDEFEQLSRRYLEDDGVNLRENLAQIEAGKVEEWLRHSEQFYRCPVCRKPVMTGARKCHHCKEEVNLRG
jgi:hypothetical protein